MATRYEKNLESLCKLRNQLFDEVAEYRAAPDFNYKWPSYQRALGGVEAIDLAISAIADRKEPRP